MNFTMTVCGWKGRTCCGRPLAFAQLMQMRHDCGSCAATCWGLCGHRVKDIDVAQQTSGSLRCVATQIFCCTAFALLCLQLEQW